LVEGVVVTKLKYNLILAILTIFLIAATAGCVQKSEISTLNQTISPVSPIKELTLSDFPELFRENTVIVIGENATKIELECAYEIAKKLEDLTGVKPLVMSDTEISEKDKTDFNLIPIGTTDTNSILNEVYELTNATKVTKEYPGKNKGILEMMRNPWNSTRALLVVSGSDVNGTKASSIMLEGDEEFESLHERMMLTGFMTLTDVEIKEIVKSYTVNMINSDPLLVSHRIIVDNIKAINNHPLLPSYYRTYYISYSGVEFYAEAIFVIDSTNQSTYHLNLSTLNLLLNKIGKETQEKDVIGCVEYYLLLDSVYSPQWYVLINKPGVVGKTMLKKPQIEGVNGAHILKSYVVTGTKVGGGYPLHPESESVKEQTIILNTYHIDLKGRVNIVESNAIKEGLFKGLPAFQISQYFIEDGVKE
jgi:hypothetical protein